MTHTRRAQKLALTLALAAAATVLATLALSPAAATFPLLVIYALIWRAIWPRRGPTNVYVAPIEPKTP